MPSIAEAPVFRPPQAPRDRARARAQSEYVHRAPETRFPLREISWRARAAPARQPCRAARSSVFRREQLGLMLLHQRVDDFAERLALQNLRQLVEREVDAVV